MKTQSVTRRTMLQGALAAAWTPAFLAKTANAGVDGNSYIAEAVAPQNMNIAYAWTDVMIQAIRDASVTPPPAGRVMAMGHMAGLMAANGIARRYSQPTSIGYGPAGASAEAAYHTAMSIALAEALQRPFGSERRRFLSQIPSSQAKALGIQWGRHVGKQIVRWRSKDGSDDSKASFYRVYPKTNHIMSWEPTLPAYRSGIGPRLDPFHRPLLPSWGAVTPFGVRDIKTHRADPFIHPASEAFAKDVRLIAQLGGTNSTIRTPDQSQIAFFWEDGPRGATPPGHFLLLACQLTQGRFDWLETARILTLNAMAGADAGISAWDSKYQYDIVRPETVIRERLPQLPTRNVGFQTIPNWTSLILTPPFPAYTSGHSTFGAAGAKMLINCLGQNEMTFTKRPVDLTWWPRQLRGVSRRFTSIWQTAEENGLSRLYGGVHWSADHYQGMRAGSNIADEIFANWFRPIATS